MSTSGSPDEQPRSRTRRVGGCLGDALDGCVEGCALPVLAVVLGAVALAAGRSWRARRRR